jgi:hypothetical protein
MVASEAQAIEGKEKNEALFAIAAAYRAFAKDHNELYRVIMGLQKSKKRSVGTGGGFRLPNLSCRCSPAMGSSRTEQMHWQRILRSMMHGFVAHEEAGGFSHFSH